MNGLGVIESVIAILYDILQPQQRTDLAHQTELGNDFTSLGSHYGPFTKKQTEFRN